MPDIFDQDVQINLWEMKEHVEKCPILWKKTLIHTLIQIHTNI